jgi:hypothetical protein
VSPAASPRGCIVFVIFCIVVRVFNTGRHYFFNSPSSVLFGHGPFLIRFNLRMCRSFFTFTVLFLSPLCLLHALVSKYCKNIGFAASTCAVTFCVHAPSRFRTPLLKHRHFSPLVLPCQLIRCAFAAA